MEDLKILIDVFKRQIALSKGTIYLLLSTCFARGYAIIKELVSVLVGGLCTHTPGS